MKNKKKIVILASVALVAAGLILSFATLCAIDFDFNKMNTLNYVTNTYTIDETFSDLSIETAESDLFLLPSEDGSCKVVCEESEEIFHSVAVENNTLSIERTDAREWYKRIVGIFWGETTVTVYLPETEYESLYARSVSGNIAVPEDFSFTDAEIHNTSGKVNFLAAVENDLSIKTVSGNLYIENANPKNLTAQSTSGKINCSYMTVSRDMNIRTVSGDITCSDMTASGNIDMDSTSGKINCSRMIASGSMTLRTVSGKIRLSGCDAESLQIKSTSGDISGTLLTEKQFLTDTTSGRIDVPASSSGGKCEVKTTSGDIQFEIE